MSEPDKTNILPVKHTTYVLQRLQDQRVKGMFCDATLIVEGEKFRVHKSFLAANSDYFLSLFTSAHEQHNFVLAGVPLQGFRVLMDFVYTSTFVLNFSNVHDVYKASSVLDFHHVKAACEKVYRKIKHNVEPSSLDYRAKRRERFRPASETLERDHSIFSSLASKSSPHNRSSPPMSHHELDKHNDIPLNFISGRNLDMHLSPHESEIPSFVKPRQKRKVKSEPNDEMNLAELEQTPKRLKDVSSDNSLSESNGRFSSPVSFEDDTSPSTVEAKYVPECPENKPRKPAGTDLPGTPDSDPSDAEQREGDWLPRQIRGSKQGCLDVKESSAETRFSPKQHPWKVLCGEKAVKVMQQERSRTQRNRRKTSKTTRISVDSSDADN